MKQNNLISQENPGFQCPHCQNLVEVTLKSLLFAKNMSCPHCHTSFEMNRQESKQAIDLMQKLNTVIDNIESVKDFSPAGYKAKS